MLPAKEKELLIIGFLLVFFAALLQNTELASFFSVKINLVLALVITLSLFIRNPWHYAVLAITGVAFLKLSSGPDWQSFVLLVLLASAFYFKKHLFGQPAMNNLFLILAATLIFYLAVNGKFLVNRPAAVFSELIYNLAVGSILYFILDKKYAVHL